MKNLLLGILVLGTVVSACQKKEQEHADASKPNIVFIYTDDLGYGDIGIHGATGVQTPHIDKLAQDGLTFTDAHSSAATCTPSRYALLTGSYAFRRKAAILPGDAPLIIDPQKETMPSMLQKAGYKTAVVGKWHLGLGRGAVDWNKEITPGPAEVGFDYSFIIPATPDRVPCVFVENQKVAGLDPDDPIKIDYNKNISSYPIGLNHPELLKMPADSQHSGSIINGVSRIGYMKGGKKALWTDEKFPLVLTQKAENFMQENKDRPFFLYFALNDIHVPRMPNQQFVGKSDMGRRGDVIAEADWVTGQVIQTLKKLGIEKNTLVIFSSDNGPILDDGYEDQAEELVGNHNPAGQFRGGKYSAYEAGTRMPTIVYWPGTVEQGVSHALVSQVDLYASLAQLTGQELGPEDAPDSFPLLDTWLGKSDKGREYMLEEAFTLAVRDGDWKYIAPQENETPDWLKNKAVETGLSNQIQLYNLAQDPGEQHNVAAEHPEIVKKLQEKLNNIKRSPTREF